LKDSQRRLEAQLRDTEWVKERDFEEVQDDVETLEEIKRTMSEFWFKNRPKSFQTNLNRNRLAVRAAIVRAINKLIESPETQHIGEHLKANIRFGFSCKYVGKWKWKF
jgi:hypothetical protein